MTIKWVVAVLLFVTSVASLLGIYQTHFVSDSLQFGSTSGSLAILAFVASVWAFSKKLNCCLSKHCDVCNPK